MVVPGLVVFDIDGTLLQTEKVTVPAVQRTFAAYGLPEPDADAICSFFGKPVQDYLDWLETLCPPALRGEIVDATNRLELDLISEEGELYLGILDVLHTLKDEGYVIGICSNGPDDYVDEFLTSHGIRPFCDIIRTRGTKYDGKESMLREIMSLIAARPAVVIGDRADDIHAAHANGALAIAAGYGFGSDEEWAQADIHVTTAHEIVDAVHKLTQR